MDSSIKKRAAESTTAPNCGPDSKITRQVETWLETEYGTFRAVGYQETQSSGTVLEHIALVKGNVTSVDGPITVRLHSKCLTSEVLHSVHCDCNLQLTAAFEIISQLGLGVIVYLDQEGRGIGLLNKLAAYDLQHSGEYDTVTANLQLGCDVDLRNHMAGVEILKDLQITNVNLLTNNPTKLAALRKNGFEVNRVALEVTIPETAQRYVLTKIQKLGHFPVSPLEPRA